MSKREAVDPGRRALFLKGGAALGATVGSGAAAAILLDAELPLQQRLAHLHLALGKLTDTEALRQLHASFGVLLENQAFEAMLELFTDDAQVRLYGEVFAGRHSGLRELFLDRYRGGHAPRQATGVRQDGAGRREEIVVGDDRLRARARFPALVQVSERLAGECTIEQMARMQGLSAATRWEPGVFTVEYARVAERWRISALTLAPA